MKHTTILLMACLVLIIGCTEINSVRTVEVPEDIDHEGSLPCGNDELFTDEESGLVRDPVNHFGVAIITAKDNKEFMNIIGNRSVEFKSKTACDPVEEILMHVDPLFDPVLESNSGTCTKQFIVYTTWINEHGIPTGVGVVVDVETQQVIQIVKDSAMD